MSLSTLPHLSNYEMTISDENQKCDMTSVNLEQTVEFLKSKKVFDLKISQGSIYV